MAKRGNIYTCHFFSFSGPQTEGVKSRWTKNLQPIGDREVAQGELVEMLVEINNDNYQLNRTSKVRYDILEEDYFLTGGADDQIISYLGDGASPYSEQFPVEQKTTSFRELGTDETLQMAVNRFKDDNLAVFRDYILIVKTKTAPTTYYIVAWWEAKQLKDNLNSEYYFIINVEEIFEAQSEEIIDVTDKPIDPKEVGPRTRLRVRGRVFDAHPFRQDSPEPIFDIGVHLGEQTTRTSLFNIDNFTNEGVRRFATRLRSRADTVTAYLWDQFAKTPAGKRLRELVNAYDSAHDPSTELIEALIDGLNEVLQGQSIYDANRFARNPLPDNVTRFIGDNLPGEHLIRFNRLLLEAVYATEITPTPMGSFVLDARFAYTSANLVEIRRLGVDTLRLRVTVNELPHEQLEIVVTNSDTNVEQVRVTRQKPKNDEIAVDVALPDLQVVVHKLRGTVYWPDSRTVDNPNYQGTPLAGKRVYALPLEEGDLGTQRPSDSKILANLKYKKGVHRSGRRGGFEIGERTDHDGNFEIKFIDLTASARYFVWAESQSGTGANAIESPETTVRTIYKSLRSLSGANYPNAFTNGRMDRFSTFGRHLIDHNFNLTRDQIRWGIEAFALVQRTLQNGSVVLQAVRPSRDNEKDTFDQSLQGENLQFESDAKKIEPFVIKCLPLVPLIESRSQQDAYQQQVVADFCQSMDQYYTRVADQTLQRAASSLLWSATNSNDFVIDFRKLDSSIDFTQGNWDATNQDQRRCELLEKTFLLRPSITILGDLENHPEAGRQPLWDFDAITLADHVFIDTVAAPNNTIDNRTRQVDTALLLGPVAPRLTGVAGKRIFLGPGEGFYNTLVPSSQLSDWLSMKGGFNLNAGEDHNDGFMAAQTCLMLEAGGAWVDSSREIRDFSAPGVEHPTDDSFEVSTVSGFPRLWQQGPVYYLGSHINADYRRLITFDMPMDAPQPIMFLGHVGAAQANDQYDKGLVAERALAEFLAGRPIQATPQVFSARPYIDIILFIHTNALNDTTVRGPRCYYYNVDVSASNNQNANTLGREFANRLLTKLNDYHNSTQQQVSVHHGYSGLRETFDHWRRKTPEQRLRQQPVNTANWEHYTFPLTLPVALVEVAFHTNEQDQRLLARGWFRRRVGEALAMAIEEQLLAGTAAVSGTLVVNILRAVFGPTTLIRALTANDDVIDANTIRNDYIFVATGINVTVNNNQLNSVVMAVEAARDAYSRQQFIRDLRNTLADLAGYPATATQRDNDSSSDDINQFVTGVILLGGNIDGLSRPTKPLTRAEAASFIATALGLYPANLGTVLTQRFRPNTELTQPPGDIALMQQLGGADHPDKFLPRAEADDIVGNIARIEPTHVYQIVELYIADESHNRIATSGGQNRYIVRVGTRLTIVAATTGIPWNARLEDLDFAINSKKGFEKSLKGAKRDTDRLGSCAWEVSEPPNGGGEGIYTLSISIKHRTNTTRQKLDKRDVRISFLSNNVDKVETSL